MKIYGIMVIYNKSLNESRSYDRLAKSNVQLIICDNSTVENNNMETAAQNGSIYLSMNGNQGLSKAYNRAVDYIWEMLKPQDEDWVCFFDDDTVIPE